MDIVIPLWIILILGFFGTIVCLSLIFWALRQLVTQPIKEALDTSKKAVQIEVEQARIQLDYGKVETRMDPKKTISKVSKDLDKLKSLRRKK